MNVINSFRVIIVPTEMFPCPRESLQIKKKSGRNFLSQKINYLTRKLTPLSYLERKSGKKIKKTTNKKM